MHCSAALAAMLVQREHLAWWGRLLLRIGWAWIAPLVCSSFLQNKLHWTSSQILPIQESVACCEKYHLHVQSEPQVQRECCLKAICWGKGWTFTFLSLLTFCPPLRVSLIFISQCWQLCNCIRLGTKALKFYCTTGKGQAKGTHFFMELW